MTSLYWIKREFYYGPLNPDKTFYLIKQPVKENGLTALIANVIGTKQMIRSIRPDFIPVVDQERIDYQKEENKDKLLIEIFGQEKSNPYLRTLNYIAVLEGLTKCQALLANVTCGAVTYALGRGTDYEFVDVKKLQDGGM